MKSLGEIFLKPEDVAAATEGEPLDPVEPAPDKLLDTINAILFAAIGICPSAWLDRRIADAQTLINMHWDTIGPKIRAASGNLRDAIDAGLRALSITLAGRPFAVLALNAVRTALRFYWDSIFAKAKPQLMAMGVKV